MEGYLKMNVRKCIETIVNILIMIVGFALMCSLFGADVSTMPPRIHKGIMGVVTNKNSLASILFAIGMFCMVNAEMCRIMRTVGCLSWGMLLAILFI